MTDNNPISSLQLMFEKELKEVESLITANMQSEMISHLRQKLLAKPNGGCPEARPMAQQQMAPEPLESENGQSM